MCCYMLYTSRYKKELLVKLEELEQEEEMANEIEVRQIGSIYEVACLMEDTKEFCDEQLAHVMSDLIQKQVISRVCITYLKSKEELRHIDKRNIMNAFMNNNYLSRQEGFSSFTYYLLYVPILQEIKKTGVFNIEGWIQFRTQKYQILLSDLLEQFVLDYSMKKEVVTFIKLMRDISILSVPLEEILHLIYNTEGLPQLYNKDMKNMTGFYIRQYCKDLLLDSTLTREDYILHILISISPKQLIIHQSAKAREQQFLKTLEIIFDENVAYCKGCLYCENK